MRNPREQPIGQAVALDPFQLHCPVGAIDLVIMLPYLAYLKSDPFVIRQIQLCCQWNIELKMVSIDSDWYKTCMDGAPRAPS